MDDFASAYRACQPIAVEHQGQRRLAAAIITTDWAVAFAEFGWDDPLCSFHPFHVIEGTLDPCGTGPWGIADVARICALRDTSSAHQWERLVRPYGERFDAFRDAGERHLKALLREWKSIT